MAPSGERKTTKTRRKSDKLQLKKKLHVRRPKNINEEKCSNSSSLKPKNMSDMEGPDFQSLEIPNTGGCSTPKAERFRIPEILTCPPAPKKQRVISNCSFQRSPIAFFAPPELELFFFFALPDISV